MRTSPDFEASSIKIKGNSILSASEIIKKAGIQLHANIFSMNPVEIKSRLEKNPWIKKAAIRRELPNHVIIDLQERKPFMIWISHTDLEKKLYLIDREGVILKEFTDENELIFNFPVLISSSIERGGEMVPAREAILEIVNILHSDIPLFKQIKKITLSSTGNVTLTPHTQSPEVRLHLWDYRKNLEYLKELFPQLNMTDLDYIDLRFKKRVIVKPNNS